MTITVSIEELRTYEEKCCKWWLARCGVVSQMAFTVRGGLRDELSPSPDIAVSTALRKWELDNPFPRLVPPV